MTYRAISAPLMLGAVLAVSSPGRAQTPSPLDNYRNLKHPPTMANFNKGWQERVLVEFDIINSADVGALRAGLKDRDPFVRSIAARALGIRGTRTRLKRWRSWSRLIRRAWFASGQSSRSGFSK